MQWGEKERRENWRMAIASENFRSISFRIVNSFFSAHLIPRISFYLIEFAREWIILGENSCKLKWSRKGGDPERSLSLWVKCQTAFQLCFSSFEIEIKKNQMGTRLHESKSIHQCYTLSHDFQREAANERIDCECVI